jgi:hypothetical protein
MEMWHSNCSSWIQHSVILQVSEAVVADILELGRQGQEALQVLEQEEGISTDSHIYARDRA